MIRIVTDGTASLPYHLAAQLGSASGACELFYRRQALP